MSKGEVFLVIPQFPNRPGMVGLAPKWVRTLSRTSVPTQIVLTFHKSGTFIKSGCQTSMLEMPPNLIILTPVQMNLV